MTVPIDKAAEAAFDVLVTWRDAGARPGGGAADELARAVFESIDTDELAQGMVEGLIRESNTTSCARICWHVEWEAMAEPDRAVVRAQAEAVKAHLLKEAP